MNDPNGLRNAREEAIAAQQRPKQTREPRKQEPINVVVVGSLPDKMPQAAIVAARTGIVGFATAVGAPFMLFAGPEMHVMIVEENPALLQTRVRRMVDIFEFWGVQGVSTLAGDTATAHVEALTRG